MAFQASGRAGGGGGVCGRERHRRVPGVVVGRRCHGARVPRTDAPPPPDRYADAVRARRAELRTARRLLAGGHRAELRSCLALSRLAATAATTAALTELGDQAREHVRAGGAARRELPARLSAALDQLIADLHGQWTAQVGPPLRRLAAERGLQLPDGWPRPPGPGPLPVVAPPADRTGLVALLDGPLGWRLVLLPAALVPLLGASAGPPPLVGGLTVVAVLAAAVATRCAAERARWSRHVDAVLAGARVALDADLGRRLLELERAVEADLDAAVDRRRAELDTELAGLAPASSGG